MAFGKKWLKPEVDKLIYYVHILILIFVAGAVMKFVFGYNSIPLNIDLLLIIKSIVALTLGDIVAHTLLKLD